ncbi:MAG: tetratricopeptide repeat protein [Cyclobacteriaceae bacterium]|nr:tetratricopeptide repeat protein [Cyclobacteriaceae bacterium]UYN85287.1 MAG: tetratricopeptide repeat protein [Cyclobacteriaceae bacterium]
MARLNLLVSVVLLSFITHSAFAQDQLSRGRLDNLYKKGLELVNLSNYGAAREVFTQYLQQSAGPDTRRAEAEYYLAYCALNLGHSDAEKRIEDFIDSNPANPRSITAYLDLANFFYNEKNYAKASASYAKVNISALTPDQRTEANFKWGYSLFSQKKLDEALTKFNAVKIQNSEYAAAANYYAGFIEFANGNYDDAYTDLKRAELNASYATVVPQLLANVLYKQKRYDDLIQYEIALRPRATTITNYSEISMLAADAYYFKKDYSSAVAAYETYLKENKSKAPASLLYRAGHAYYSLGQDDKAIEYLKNSATSSDSVGYYASYYLGILYLKQGNKPFASTSFDNARKYLKDKDLVEESTFQYAKVSYDLGKPDQAIAEFERFLKGFPSSTYTTEVKELLAQAYVNGNNYNKAIEYIESLPRRSQAVDQAYQKATFLKGSELFNKDDYEGAEQFFDKSLRYPIAANYTALASFWSGEAYSLNRKYEEAIKRYQKVVSLGTGAEPETLAKARYGLAYAHFNLQQYEQALFNFKDFTNRSPKSGAMYVDGLVRLADCYYVRKVYPDALSTYNRARQLNSPDDDYILFQTGVINGILRNYTDARNQFSVLISSYPKSQYRDEAIFQRAQFEIEQGNYEAAANGLTQLINEGAGSRFLPYAYMRRAASYFNMKQYDRTANDYAAILQKFPQHPVAQQVLLPLQEALGLAGRSGEFENYLALYKKANPESKNLEVVEFEAAKTLYFDQQYARAITAFNGFLINYPQSSRIQEAHYYLAESHYRQRELEKALSIYTALSSDPTFSMLNRVVARMAEIEFRLGRYEKAIVSYRRMERLAVNKKDQFNAWSGMMDSFFLLAQYDSVNAYANIILEKGNINAGAQNKATLYLGKSAMARGQYDVAKDEFINTLNTARDEFGAEAKYRLGEIFFLTKEYKQCYETLVGIDAEFGAYEEWVGRSFLLLADNFIAMNNVFQAKATLQSLIDKFPLQHIKDAAKEKLRKINADEDSRKKQVAADTVGNN